MGIYEKWHENSYVFCTYIQAVIHYLTLDSSGF